MQQYFAYSTQRVSTPSQGAKGNTKISLLQLENLIKTPQNKDFARLRALFREGYESGDKAKLEAAKSLKNRLPWFLPSGFCAIHHNNETLEYNGVVQGDLDLKIKGGDVLARMLVKVVRQFMESGGLPFVAFVCISPSGYGVKFLLTTDCTDIAQHGAAAKAVIGALSASISGYIPEGGKFDSLGASQPCFLPSDEEAYFNHNAVPFHFVAPENPTNTDTAPTPKEAPQRHHSGTTADANELRAAYNFLLESKAILATCYDEYLPVLAGCIAAFGNDGADAARQLLENSPAFLVSNFQKNFNNHAKGFKTTKTPPRWLLKQARAHGWRGGHHAQKDAPQTILNGAAGEKLTDILLRHSIKLPGKRWVVGTGTGKTYAVAAFANAGSKTVLAVPYSSIAHNVAAQYGAVLFDGKTRNIVQDAGFYVTTYASLPALSSRLDAVAAWHLFLDEAHNFTTSAARGYMWKNLCRVLDIASHFATLTSLTGTEVATYHPLLLGLPKMEVVAPRTIPKILQIIRTKNTLDAAARGVVRALELGKKCVVALNDKGTKLEKLKVRLKAIGGASVAYFNSENKDGNAFAELCQNGKFPEGVNVIVTTSVLKEGNNINDKSHFAFIFLGRFHAVEIEQLTARAREAESIEAVLIKGERKASNEAVKFEANKVKAMVEQKAQKQTNQLNAAGAAAGWSPYIREVLAGGVRAFEKAKEGRALPIVEKEGAFCICPLLLGNYVFEAEKGAQHTNDQAQEEALKKYGFNVLRGAVVNVAQTVNKEAERAAVDAYKVEQNREYNETLGRLEAGGATQNTIQNELEQIRVKGGTRAALEVVARVVAKGLTVGDAVAAVRKYAPKPSKKKAGELCDLITFCSLSDNLSAVQSTEVGRFVVKMKAAFSDGEKVTTDELIKRVEKVTGKTYDNEKRADKALKVARLLFDVQPTKVRFKDGGGVHVWRVCSVNFEYYNKKKNQKVNGTTEQAAHIFTRLEVGM